MATINGTFNSLIAGTLSGTVATPGATGPAGPAGPAGPQGVPGAPGVGVPAGGTTGQFLTKSSNLDYATGWSTLSLAGYATESWVTAGFYPLTGNPSGFLTASALTPYLTKADNLGSLTNFATARDNLNLGTLNSPTFAALTLQGSGANVGQYTPTSLTLTHATSGSFVIQPSSGITFPDTSIQTTAFNASVLLPYAPLLSPVFSGDPQAPTAAFGDNDTSIATTAFVQAGLLGGTAVARNLEVEVRNQSGSTIAAGSIVYISGATGNKPLITLAQANNDANSAQTIGFVKTAIANNGTGFVIVRGELENIDTSALTEGVQLYLSPTVAGSWTTTKPSAPQHLVYVGIVIRSHPTLGTILVAVQNGYELDELHDVLITTPSTGQVLAYDGVTGLWKNQAAAGGAVWGGITGTLSSQTDLQSALNAKANLSGATFTGKVNLASLGASSPSINLGAQCDSAPASATNGDIWISNAASPKITYRTGGINYNVAVLNQFNTFTGQMVINTTSSSTAALRVTQLGTANAIEVEDSTSPDSTRFVVDQHGKVGIGVAPDSSAALKVDTNGIMFGDGTTQTTAAVSGFIPGSGNLELGSNYVQSGTSSSGSKLDGNSVSATAGLQDVPGTLFRQSVMTSDGQGTGESSYGTDGFGNPYVILSKQNGFGADSFTGTYNDYDTAVYKSFSLSALNGLNFGSGTVSVTSTGITFPDSTVQTTAAVSGITDAPSDGNYYVRKDGAWVQCTVVSIYDSNSSASYNCLTV